MSTRKPRAGKFIAIGVYIYINDFEFHRFGFPCSHEKRAGIPKFFLSFLHPVFVYTLLPEYIYIHIVNATPSKSLMIIGYIIKS